MLDCDPERVDCLPGQRPATAVDDRHADDERDVGALLLEHVLDRCDRGLAVQGVEDRLYEQEVGAALEQATSRLGIPVAKLIERHGSIAGVVDARRQRQRDIRRPERAGDESRAVRCDRPPSDFGPGPVELLDIVLEPVLRL